MKEKIAISIDEDVLREVDRRIDNKTLQNRSQAIEHLLRKSLDKTPINQAMIMSRPGDLKYLLTKIQNKVVLEQNCEVFNKAGIEKIYLVTQEHELLKEIKKKFPKISIIKIKTMRGTADNIKALRKKVTSDFIVVNSDTYYDFDLKKMLEKHKTTKRHLTLGIISTTDAEKYGSVRLEGERIVEFKQKEIASPIINAGVYVFSPKIFDYLDKDTISIESEVLPALVRENQVTGFFMYGKYIHVQKMDNIQMLEEDQSVPS